MFYLREYTKIIDSKTKLSYELYTGIADIIKEPYNEYTYETLQYCMDSWKKVENTYIELNYKLNHKMGGIWYKPIDNEKYIVKWVQYVED